MAITRKLADVIDKVANSGATFQIASERAADLLTFATVSRATDTLVQRVAVEGAGSEAAALASAARNIKVLQVTVQSEMAAAVIEARDIAREFAMRQLSVELEPVLVGRGGLSLTPTLAQAEVEAMWAHHASTATARAFGTKAIGEVEEWRRVSEGSALLSARLQRVAARLEAERKRQAVYQAVQAFNEAKHNKTRELKEGGPARQLVERAGVGGQLPPDVFDRRIRQLWSGFLDGKTCPVCWKLDGTMVRIDESFPEGARTPLHGHCRCTVLNIFIPESLERYLPGAELDYDALKDDIRDYMRSRSGNFNYGTGVRHAERYVHDVLEQRGHSPVVLAERFNNRQKYFPNVPKQKAPSLRW